MIDPGDGTLGTLLERLAASPRGRRTLTVEAAGGTKSSITYTELGLLSRRLATGLRAAGIGPGDCVIVHLPNSVEGVATWFGLAMLGAIFVPSNPAFTALEVSHLIAVSGARLAVVDAAGRAVVEECGLDAEHIVLVDDTQDRASWSLAKMLTAEPLSGERPSDPEAVVELVFTSGTTAAPKAAMITHANCLFSGLQKSLAMEVGDDDVLLSALPLFHVNAQSALLAALTAGVPFVLLERYSASRYCEQLGAHDASLTSLVGTQVRTLLRQQPGPHERAHRVRRAWFALNVGDDERAAFEERFGIRLVNGYGLTEAFTSVTQAPLRGPDHWPSVGRPLPGREVRILDSAGRELPVGESGEIVVGGQPGKTVMAGYWRDPDATQAVLRGGWLHTGDHGRLDGDGYLHFVERKANLIKRAGENVSAGEVERTLREHPAVADAAVVGVPDEVRDEAVKAFVVPADGSEISLAELERHCRERLAAFKVPTLWSVRDTLPKSSIGKTEYRRLRDDHIGSPR